MIDNEQTIYDKVKAPPKEALKAITGGRLRGKTDINPMWRIKKLTELFGVCGFGWKYEILSERLEKGAGDEVAAFVQIHLYVKMDGVWSEPIPGTGGSGFVQKEKEGPYTSDECFKMALTDAISVACKALGFGADVYWDKDANKYDKKEPENAPKENPRDENLERLRDAATKGLDELAKVFLSLTKKEQVRLKDEKDKCKILAESIGRQTGEDG